MYLKSLTQSCGLSERAKSLLDRYKNEVSKDRYSASKSLDIAKQLREFGVEYAEHQFYLNAIELFNRALCFAPPKTAMISYLYSNRANVFFAMELYTECLDSLNMALENNYPCELRHYLEEKAEICLQKLAAQDCPTAGNSFKIKLSHRANAKVPSIIQDIHLENNEQFGRHLIADVDLQVGDVICIESAFVNCLDPMKRFERCSYCLEEQPHRLFPCRHCTNAMFCSVACEDAAWQTFHRDECDVTEELFSQVQDIHRLAFRTFLRVMQLFDRNIGELRKFLVTNQERKISPLDLDHRKLCERDQFLAFFQGHASDAHFKNEIRDSNLEKSIVLASLLGEYTDYGGQMESDETKVFVMETFYHFITVNSNNCYEINSSTPTCLGLYLCMSMAAHSCSGNVHRLRNGLQQLWVVCRPIARGSQIFDNYGSNFLHQSKEQRQYRSKEHYGFECQCDACTFDYPMAAQLEEPKEVPWPRSSFLTRGGPMNIQKIKAEFTMLRTFITTYGSYFPCSQLRLADWRLTDLFRRLTNDTSLWERYPEFYSNKALLEGDV